MPELKVTVTNKYARAGNKSIVCDNSDYIIRFDFDEEWAELTTKTARFIWNNQYVDVIFEGDTCAVPSITSTNYLSVGVFAGDLKTTTPAVFSCCKSILSEGGTPSEPTPDVYAEIMMLLNKKPNSEDVYTKAETDSMLDEKANADVVYSKTEIDEKFLKVGMDNIKLMEKQIHENSDNISQLQMDVEETDNAVKSLEKIASELTQRNVFTNEEKEKLSGLKNYDDSEIREQLGSKANADEVYSKSEIDTMLGDVESVLATIVEV